MEKLNKIASYICSEYEKPEDLSKARFVKMIYLADWKSAIINGKQLTDIKWVFNHYGPYVEDIINRITESGGFEIREEKNIFNTPKYLIYATNEIANVEFEARNTSEILDSVMEQSVNLRWREFISMVYSTYPVEKSNRYSVLDLEKLAKEYNAKNV